jgi:transcriptional regulator with XRE-family HTH domain
VTPVLRWSGRKARALREAKRMSVRDFAAHLGVNDAAVSNWERRGELARLRHQTQQMLDVDLARSGDDVRDRFELLLLVGRFATAAHVASPAPPAEPAHRHQDVGLNPPRSLHDAVRENLPALRRALDSYDLPLDGPVRPLGELQRAVAHITRMRLESNYKRLAVVIPPFLAELHRALYIQVGQRRAEAAGVLAQAYRAADAIADKFGLFDLSARIIGLMTWAARESGDELTMAAAAYVRGEIFFASSDFETGRRLLAHAAERLLPGSTAPASAAYGALHMRAAVLAARAGQLATADDHFSEARLIAEHGPESVYHGTAFGPGSVLIHQVTLAVDSARIHRPIVGETPRE